MFLKYLDGLEQDKATEAALDGRAYGFILDAPYRWERWAVPKGADGKLDHNAALTGDDLRDFVNLRLFPYLHKFRERATGPDTIEYKIGQIYGADSISEANTTGWPYTIGYRDDSSATRTYGG